MPQNNPIPTTRNPNDNITKGNWISQNRRHCQEKTNNASTQSIQYEEKPANKNGHHE